MTPAHVAHRRRPLAAAALLPPPPLLLLLVMLASACGVARAQQSSPDCESNPTVAGCQTYSVDDAVLQRDLESLCSSSQLGAAASGWPAACSLWAECAQGRSVGAGCQPLTLIQTACNEEPQQAECMK